MPILTKLAGGVIQDCPAVIFTIFTLRKENRQYKERTNMTSCNKCIKEDVCFIKMKHGHGREKCACYLDKEQVINGLSSEGYYE